MKKPGFLKSLLYSKRGQAALEFVFLVPLIIIVIVFVSQSGHMVYRKNILQQASREGVRVVSTTNSNQMAIQAVVKVCGSEEIPDIKIYPGDEARRKLGDIVTVNIIDDSLNSGLWNIISTVMGSKIILKAESSMRMECQ